MWYWGCPELLSYLPTQVLDIESRVKPKPRYEYVQITTDRFIATQESAKIHCLQANEIEIESCQKARIDMPMFLFSNRRTNVNWAYFSIFTFLCKLRVVSHVFVCARSGGVKIRLPITPPLELCLTPPPHPIPSTLSAFNMSKCLFFFSNTLSAIIEKGWHTLVYYFKKGSRIRGWQAKCNGFLPEHVYGRVPFCKLKWREAEQKK